MNKTVISITRFAAATFAAVVISGCEAEKSRNPLSPNVAGPIAGVSISPPTPVNPVNAEVLNTGPVRLVVNNASTNGERPLFYIVEVASDAAFTNKVFAQSRVTPGTAQTTVVVDAALTPDRTYYWRAKADDGANESDFSSVAKFDVVVPIVIEAPVPVSPVSGAVASSTSPALVVNNAGVQGRAGHVDYWFELAQDQAFARTIVGLAVARSGGSTTSAQMPELPGNTLLFWRVVGIGVNGTVTGPWSLTQSFRTPASAPPPSPGPSPGPNPPPPAAGCNASGSPANWSTAQWRECFFALVAARGVGPNVSFGAMAALRPDLVARGADFQNGWRGDYRARIFLPVPNCPPPTNPSPPDCTYSRTVDLGDDGGPWQWFPR